MRIYLLLGLFILRIGWAFAQNYEITQEEFLSDSIDVDYLIVTDSLFKDVAYSFCLYRDTLKKDFVYSPRFVTTQTLYLLYLDSFKTSYLPKAFSIREGIRRIKELSQGKLQYVVLLGDGYSEYDTLEHPNFIPMIYDKNLISTVDSIRASDDFYVSYQYGVSNIYPTFAYVGRIPADNIDEAWGAFYKIKRYEGNPFGDYKRKILISVDDDEISPEVIDPYNHERLVEKYVLPYIPEGIEKENVYLQLYPKDDESYKPLAEADFIDYINKGVFITLFSGHSHWGVLAIERVFKSWSTPSLVNKDLTIFVVLGCYASKFDLYNEKGVVERIFITPEYGAVAGIGSIMEVYAIENNEFGGALLEKIYDLPSKKTIGETFYYAKTAYNYTGYYLNSSSYELFGDPAMIIVSPIIRKLSPDTLDIESVNKKDYSLDYLTNWSVNFFVYPKDSSITYTKRTLTGEDTITITKALSPIVVDSSITTSNIYSVSFYLPFVDSSYTPLKEVLYAYNKDIYQDFIYYNSSYTTLSGNSLKVNEVFDYKLSYYYKDKTEKIIKLKEGDITEKNGEIIIRISLSTYIDSLKIYLNSISLVKNSKKLENDTSFYISLSNITSFYNTLRTILYKNSSMKEEEFNFKVIDENSSIILKDSFIYPNPYRTSSNSAIIFGAYFIKPTKRIDVSIYNSKGKRLIKKSIYGDFIGYSNIKIDPYFNGKKVGKGIYIVKISVWDIYNKNQKKTLKLIIF